LHGTKWRDGKKKKVWKPLSSKKNLVLDSEGNEENGYPVPNLNKTKINNTKKPNDVHKKHPQRRNLSRNH
jgi:hypothetical protein